MVKLPKNRRMPSVGIVGAGMSGLCLAIKLKHAGVDSITIYEKADAIGGTWRDNRYPGLSCDVPSRFYQYSFAPNTEWSHFFSAGAEIRAYFEKVTDDFDLRRHIRFGTEVVDGRFSDNKWLVTTKGGQTAQHDFLISATGVLHHPRYPKTDGLDRFGGDVFHSARWKDDVDLRGKRVGVIGTGSTGVQIVTATAEIAAHVTMFQRTPQWIFPFPNPRVLGPAKLIYRNVPGANRIGYLSAQRFFSMFTRAVVRPGLERTAISALCRRNLASVKDPDLRRKLTPDYEPMCKRLVISSGFYAAVQQPHVDVVDDPIDHVTESGVVTRDGRSHELDVLVLATGFDAHAFLRPMQLTGPDGTTLDDVWNNGPRAYHTVAVPGFPNFFMLIGPHSPIGNYSLVAIAESQADHIVRWVEKWRAGQFETVVPTAAATDEFNEQMRASMGDTVWVSGCDSWYLGADGKPELWPWSPGRHRRMLAKPVAADWITMVSTDSGQNLS